MYEKWRFRYEKATEKKGVFGHKKEHCKVMCELLKDRLTHEEEHIKE